MRTQEELVAKIREEMKKFLGFGAEVLLPYLDYAHAKEFIKPEITEEKWNENPIDTSEEQARKDMADYMKFAWDKVADHRGISANRSVDKMEAWAWLLGRDDVVAAMDEAPYENYGAPKLAAVCRMMDFPIPEEQSIQNMISSLDCCPGCDMGCGR
jgi:hypothetical protein